MNDKAFEKWWSNNYSNLDHRDILRTSEKVWQAAKADSEQEIAELKAHVYDLREALEENHYCNSSEKAINLYNAAISKTPAQSLQEHDNEVIERCACECENHWDVDSAAETIRKLKV